MSEPVIIGPQAGPQTEFLRSPADIVIYGGSAGGGKSYALLLEALRHTGTPGFTAVLFRRTTKLLINPGGLWDSSYEIYPMSLGTPRQNPNYEWVFGKQMPQATIRFAHMEHEKNRFDWQGSQICCICFDELTEFESSQFWYMQSRNRSTCGVQPYMRATTNPDADSWVARLIDWYIDDDGYAIPERSGVIRWIERDGDVIRWYDKRHSEDSLSFTFIRSKLEDNQKLLQVDPRYRARLTSGLTIVDRERLLHGNWKIRPAAGLYFNREWVELVDPRDVPERLRAARGWDLAGTEERPGTDPDWTCGVKMALSDDDDLWILDHVYDRMNPGGVKDLVKRTAKEDTQDVEIAIPQDPGQAGKSQVEDYIQMLRGYTVRSRTMSGDKVVRFSPFSARCLNGFKHGNKVKVVRAHWNDRLFRELENFPPKKEGGKIRGHDDDADACSEAFWVLNNRGGSILTGRWYTG